MNKNKHIARSLILYNIIIFGLKTGKAARYVSRIETRLELLGRLSSNLGRSLY